MKKILFLFLISTILVSCARVGSPDGGTKDAQSPIFLRSNIDSPRVNVSRNIKELRLDFDEYITLKEINKNLIISPPIKGIKKIIPNNLANKYVLIQWKDSLEANTTYNFNFGNAIVDYNESNPLPYFSYAFSTGSAMDSLYVAGTIRDALAVKKDPPTAIKNGVVGLYKVTDSTNFSGKPDYISRIEDDGYFELNYLPHGKYHIIAFEDENQNSVFDQGKEKIAFLKEDIQLDDKVSGLQLNLFPSEKPFGYKEIKPIIGGLMLLFEGNPETLEIISLDQQLQKHKTSHKKYSDSAFVWFNAKNNNLSLEQGTTLSFHYKSPIKEDTVATFYKHNPKTELSFSSTKGNLIPPEESFVLKANIPIEKIISEKWTLKSDSISQNFAAKINEKNLLEIIITADFSVGKQYSLNIPKGSVLSYDETNPKTYIFNFEIDKAENYGNFLLRLKNKPETHFWLQLLNEKDEVQYSQYTNVSEIKFVNLKPATYHIRILVDENENQKWDLANFKTKTFAEPVYIFQKNIVVRQKWDIVEDWDLSQTD